MPNSHMTISGVGSSRVLWLWGHFDCEIVLDRRQLDFEWCSIPSGEKLLAALDCGFAGSGGFNFGISNLFEISNLGFRISCLVVAAGHISKGTPMTERSMTLSVAAAIFTCVGWLSPAIGQELQPTTFEQYLRSSAVSKELIDRFLSGPSWAQFDPVVGYILGNYLPDDGMDRSTTISTVQGNGARTSHAYASRKCRINTYGDSFTLCHQVSDPETWQEYLAGHLGEPIRNFGMGGYGVYQAYRRMVREEQTDQGAENLIFYIWGDDHIRSLLRCRHANIYRHWDHQGGRMFHNNFWANLEMNLESGEWVEKDNLLPTREALYHMTDPEWMVEHLRDDLALQLSVYKAGFISDLDRQRVTQLAARLDYPIDWTEPSTVRAQISGLLDRYSLRATLFILGKVRDFAQQHNKQLLIVLFDPYRVMPEMHRAGTRYDQEVVDYLTREKFNYFDMNEVHLRDFQQYKLPYAEYMKLYFIGHYNPRGNHFFAYSIKDRVIDMLDPKPVTYQKIDPQSVDFKGYLEEYR